MWNLDPVPVRTPGVERDGVADACGVRIRHHPPVVRFFDLHQPQALRVDEITEPLSEHSPSLPVTSIFS